MSMLVWLQRRGEGAQLNPDSVCWPQPRLLWRGSNWAFDLLLLTADLERQLAGAQAATQLLRAEQQFVSHKPKTDRTCLRWVASAANDRFTLYAARRTLTVWNSVLSLNRTGLIQSASNKLFMPDWNETRQSPVCSHVSSSLTNIPSWSHFIKLLCQCGFNTIICTRKGDLDYKARCH